MAGFPQKINGAYGEALVSVASLEDVRDVVALFDGAVVWLAGRGITGQWGTTPFSQIPAMRSQFEGWVARSELFIARVGGEAVGTIVLSETIPDYALRVLPRFTEPAFYLEAFTTSRAFAGQGIGHDLLAWATNYSLTRGKRAIWLDCWADNPPLVAYYESAGFVPLRDFYVGEWRGMLFHKELAAG